MKCTSIDGLAVHEVVARGDGHGASVARVGVVKVIRPIVDDCRVANVRVVEIHVTVVAAACTVPGMKWFAWAKRKPTNSAAKSSAETDTPMRAADEPDECRPINRTRVIRARAPAPTAANVGPTAIVEGSETPRRIVNPRPAPRPNVAPITVAVRCPADIHSRRIPNRAVIRFLIP